MTQNSERKIIQWSKKEKYIIIHQLTLVEVEVIIYLLPFLRSMQETVLTRQKGHKAYNVSTKL
jgi:hypothetical protein